SERNDRLHRSLTERSGADEGGALVILKRTRDDLGCRSRATIDQHDYRLAACKIAALRIEALSLLGMASACRGDLSAIEERVRDRDRLIQEPARIIAQIDDVAFERRAGILLDGGDRALEAFLRLIGEGGDADITDILVRALDARLDRLHLNLLAHQLDIERVLALAKNS